MKISVTKKLLIICLSLILALTTALFAAFCLTRSSYAFVSPDGSSAYAEGEGDEKPKVPDGSAIVPPQQPDDTAGDWTVLQQQITMQVGKLEIRVDGWKESGLSTSPRYNTNPDGKYDAYPDLVKKAEALLKSSDFITVTIKDVGGNEIKDTSALGYGVTVFIHYDVSAKYADSVNLVYKSGVTESYAYTTEFASGTKLTEVEKPSKLVYEIEFDGSALDLKKSVLDEVLKDRDTYLAFVASESASLAPSGAGEYRLTVAFKDGVPYCWKNTGIVNDRTPLTISVIVKPKVLEVVDDLGDEWVYSGYEINVANKLKEVYGDYVVVAAGYSTVGKDAKEYTFHIILNPAYNGSVTWAEGVEEPVAVKWTIKKAVVKGEWIAPQSEYGRITVTSESDYRIQADDIEYVYKENGTAVAADALQIGHTYEVTVVLKNGDNLQWADPEPGPHTFELNKELIALPKPEIVDDKKEFTGSEHSFAVTVNGKPLTSEEFAGKIKLVEELSDKLTQTAVGKYKVVIRIIDDSVSWAGNATGDVVLAFEITPIQIDVEWDETSGTPSFSTANSSVKDFSDIVKITYHKGKDSPMGDVVTKSQMVKGEWYTAVIAFTEDGALNYVWSDDAKTKLQLSFQLNVDFIALAIPELSKDTFPFTGKEISVTESNPGLLVDEYRKNGYIEVVSGDLKQTNAGEYDVVLKIIDKKYIWENYDGEYVKLHYTIEKAVLTGEWQSNGKVKFTSSFEGDYDKVVEYIYTDGTGREYTSLAQLVDGVEYTATVRLRDGQEQNFEEPQLAPFTFTHKSPDDGGSSLWWLWLLLGLLLLGIIILIIVLLAKRRKNDDEYDDYYDDEYYGDEEGAEEGDGDDGENYDNYDGDDNGGEY